MGVFSEMNIDPEDRREVFASTEEEETFINQMAFLSYPTKSVVKEEKTEDDE